MAITRFENIQGRQAARELSKAVYHVTRTETFSWDFSLVDQARRASVSAMANIAEGFDSHSNSEFIRFLYYALRSASEVQSHLYVALDQGYITEAEFTAVYQEASKTKRLVFSLIEYLRTHNRP
ncbi:MAG TPA: four helix bundle protein [Candidatus Eisenbacteria bacterium]|nr:four helix bundle protein [Candidatus Eisenbacteria bacterium]